MKVLMVDDEPLICDSMRLLLELDGHEMDEAHSGLEALDKFAQRRFDLVFTDFSMPGMKGDQLAREFKGRSEGTPIVMVTGFPPCPAPREVTRIVVKPFDLHAIRGVLHELSSREI